MSAPDAMAQWMPATMSWEVPAPSSFKTLAAMILDWGATPTIPLALHLAAMIPETWVP